MTEDNQIDLFEGIKKTLEHHEKNLTWKKSGEIHDRIDHVLSQYRSIADNAIFECKRFMEDCKTQYKALEIIAEGLTDSGLNHTHKRVIANHMISMLRNMVDKLNNYQYEYSTTAFQRYDFFRSQSPERKLHEERRELKQQKDWSDKVLKTLQEVHPDIYKSLTQPHDDIPF